MSKRMVRKVVRDQSRYWQNDTEKSYYHLIVKVYENTPGNVVYPFNFSQKCKLEEMLWRLDDFYLTEVVSYCLMDNHAHIILVRDNQAHLKMGLKEVALRYQEYYELDFTPDARSAVVKNFRKRLNSVSEFMRDFQRQFAWWYNRNLPEKRAGSLWGRCFKSVVLKSRKAFVECMKYVELNPVRAKMVAKLGDYSFSSWGHIVRGDKIGKKLQLRLVENLRYMMGKEAEFLSDREVFLAYAGNLIALGVAVAENKEVKRIDSFSREYLLAKCDYWQSLKSIGGEDILIGEGKGRRRPKIFKFTVE